MASTIQPDAASTLGEGSGAARDLGLRIAYVSTVVVVLTLVSMPLLALVYGSLRSSAPGLPGEWTTKNFANLASSGVVNSILTTLYIALLSSALCVVVGLALALLIHRTDFAFKRAATVLLSLSFYLPSFILAMAWIIIGSPGGLANAALSNFTGLRVDIFSVAGIVFVMTLHQIPFVYLIMRGPIIGMDASFEEAARVAGARSWTVLARVTLPLLAHALLSAAILTCVMNLEQFAIPALLGIPANITVLATQLYLLIRYAPADYGLAAAIGLTLSLITGLAIWAQRRVSRAGRLTTVTGKSTAVTIVALGRWKWAAYLFFALIILMTIVLPAVILVYTSVLKWYVSNPLQGVYTLRNYTFLLQNQIVRNSVRNTFVVCLVAAVCGVGLGLLCSYFVLRLKPKGYRALDLLITLPIGVPGIVIGLGLLWAYAYLHLPIYGTVFALIFAFVTRYLPYATETIGGQMVQIDRSLEESAWTSGATRLRALRLIMMPLTLPSLQASFFLLFMVFFREISCAILLYAAGNEVLSISIWAFFESADWGQASALSVVATIVIFLAMSAILWILPSTRRG